MSEKSNDLGEKEQKVVITAEEVNSALDFWRHFGIDMPAELQTAFDSFKEDPSFENQQKIKLAICKDISTSQHEAFQDEMFAKIREECAGVTFEMQFDKDLEETVTVQE